MVKVAMCADEEEASRVAFATSAAVLAEIRAETDNWRFRHLLSSQLGAFGAAFSRSAVQETLLPLALSLCTDSVAEVRLAAVPEVGTLVRLLVEAPLDTNQNKGGSVEAPLEDATPKPLAIDGDAEVVPASEAVSPSEADGSPESRGAAAAGVVSRAVDAAKAAISRSEAARHRQKEDAARQRAERLAARRGRGVVPLLHAVAAQQDPVRLPVLPRVVRDLLLQRHEARGDV